MIYVFDVDGTLARSDEPMEPEFVDVLKEFMQTRKVYFCSGSALPKMKMQLPEEIVNLATGMMPTNGCELWQNGELIFQKKFEWPTGLRSELEKWLEKSTYPAEKRAGDHIQDRTTMVCFSTCGKGANLAQRAEYIQFEESYKERAEIAKDLGEKFPMLSFLLGGQISIDIIYPGRDKGQLLGFFRETTDEPVTFFGDRMESWGNDYPLAQKLEQENAQKGLTGEAANKVEVVTCWQDTMQRLQQLMAAEKAA